VSFEHWDDPKLRRIGEKFVSDAYRMAHDLDGYGADALAWLMTDEQRCQRWEDVDNISIPAAFADALVVLLLALPRKGSKRGRRALWSISEAQRLVDSGRSIRSVAREFSERTGLPEGNIRRRLLRAKKAGTIRPKNPRR
jgi:hypothetical protein